MGSVFKAMLVGSENFQRACAVKIIRLEAQDDSPELLRRFIQEARVGGSLHHPNLVASIDFDCVQGLYFIAMELVEGPTVAQLIAAHRRGGRTIPGEIALEIARQACVGLDYVHGAHTPDGQSLGLIHRDIKPSNLLLDPHGYVRIADFGVARMTEALGAGTQLGLPKGTIAYMAPEQANAEAISHKVDQFALCLVLLEMLTLKRVYTGGDPDSLLERVQTCQHAPLREMLDEHPWGQEVLPLLSRGMAPDPDGRFSSAREMAQAIEDLLFMCLQPVDLQRWLLELDSSGAWEPDGARSHGTGESGGSGLPVLSLWQGSSLGPGSEGAGSDAEPPVRLRPPLPLPTGGPSPPAASAGPATPAVGGGRRRHAARAGLALACAAAAVWLLIPGQEIPPAPEAPPAASPQPLGAGEAQALTQAPTPPDATGAPTPPPAAATPWPAVAPTPRRGGSEEAAPPRARPSTVKPHPRGARTGLLSLRAVDYPSRLLLDGEVFRGYKGDPFTDQPLRAGRHRLVAEYDAGRSVAAEIVIPEDGHRCCEINLSASQSVRCAETCDALYDLP